MRNWTRERLISSSAPIKRRGIVTRSAGLRLFAFEELQENEPESRTVFSFSSINQSSSGVSK